MPTVTLKSALFDTMTGVLNPPALTWDYQDNFDVLVNGQTIQTVNGTGSSIAVENIPIGNGSPLSIRVQNHELPTCATTALVPRGATRLPLNPGWIVMR